MNHSVYPTTRKGKMTFRFVSNDTQGTNPVKKMVLYSPIVRLGKNYYNLEFGDYDVRSRRIDDLVITDNGDMRRVLRTVVATLETFLADFPNELVHLDGSDPVRRAYYHKLIRDYYNFIVPHFEVQGHARNGLETFRVGVQYDFIAISRRKL